MKQLGRSNPGSITPNQPVRPNPFSLRYRKLLLGDPLSPHLKGFFRFLIGFGVTSRKPTRRSEKTMRYIEWLWKSLADTMKSGGCYERVMDSGPELERVKNLVQVLAGERKDPRVDNPPGENDVNPLFIPLMEGIRNEPFPDPAIFDWIPELEKHTPQFLEEANRVRQIYVETAYGDGAQKGGRWLQGNINAFGSRLPEAVYQQHTPNFAGDIAAKLPRMAAFSGYPYAHALYSSMDPGARILPHTSGDNLRIRLHLGLSVPPDCAIRVSDQVRTWENGKALLLDDSFIHEVWNKSDQERVVLILDFWHPDLTDEEIKAITMIFKKSEMRDLIMPSRNVPKEVCEALLPLYQGEDREDQELAEWWPKQPTYIEPQRLAPAAPPA